MQSDNSNAGTAQADVLFGTGGADTLSGLGGGDVLFASDGDDVLTGGAGDDSLIGGAGNDTYRFDLGDGQDSIDDSTGTADAVVFGPGIAPADVTGSLATDPVSGLTDSLLLRVAGTADQLLIRGHMNGRKVEIVRFADGTVWNLSQLDDLARTVNGTADADTFWGDAAEQPTVWDWRATTCCLVVRATIRSTAALAPTRCQARPVTTATS